MSPFGRIYISKDVFFSELRFPYSDPSSFNSTKSLDSYFSLSPNLSPPCAATIPPTNSGSVPLIPPDFSPLSTHSPITTVSVLLLHPFLLNIEIMSSLPFLHPLQTLLLHLPLSQLTLTPCKQDLNLEFTILDSTLHCFSLILSLSL